MQNELHECDKIKHFLLHWLQGSGCDVCSVLGSFEFWWVGEIQRFLREFSTICYKNIFHCLHCLFIYEVILDKIIYTASLETPSAPKSHLTSTYLDYLNVFFWSSSFFWYTAVKKIIAVTWHSNSVMVVQRKIKTIPFFFV